MTNCEQKLSVKTLNHLRGMFVIFFLFLLSIIHSRPWIFDLHRLLDFASFSLILNALNEVTNAVYGNRHAGRSTINVSDVMLLARRNEGLQSILPAYVDRQKEISARAERR